MDKIKTFLALKSTDGPGFLQSVMSQQYTWGNIWPSLASGLPHIVPPHVSASFKNWQLLTRGQPHPAGSERGTQTRFWLSVLVRTVAVCVQLLLVCSQIIQRLWTTLMLNSCAMTPFFNHHSEHIWAWEYCESKIQEFLRGVCIINIKHVWTISTWSWVTDRKNIYNFSVQTLVAAGVCGWGQLLDLTGFVYIWSELQWITVSGVRRAYVLKCCVWVTVASVFRVFGARGFTWKVENLSTIITKSRNLGNVVF